MGLAQPLRRPCTLRNHRSNQAGTLLPVTFGLPPTSALIMLSGIYYGAQYGGSTTAILINLPGESSSVVTAMDGYQMARQGKARRHSPPPPSARSSPEPSRPYHPSDFQAAQRGGGAMRRCRQRRKRRRPRVKNDIRLRATFLRCVPAAFFRPGFGSRRHPTFRSIPPNEGPAPAPERAGPAGRCARSGCLPG